MMKRLARHIATPLAVIFLQLAFALYYWMPERGGWALVTPVWEHVAVLALAFGLAQRRWPRFVVPAVKVVLTASTLGFVCLGFAQGIARLEFGYDVALAIDLKFVPVLFEMMRSADSPLRMAVSYLIIAAVVVATVLGVYLAISCVHAVAADPLRRRPLAGALAGVVLVLALVLGMQPPLTRVVADQLDLYLHRAERVRLIARRMEQEVAEVGGAAPFQLGAAKPPTILIFIVESYGAAVFEQAQFAGFRTWLSAESRGLTAAGYRVRSRYFGSPTFGGSSWMANSTLLCGVKVNNQRRYEGLRQADIPCLPELLERAGYDTLLAAASTTFVDAAFRRLFPVDKLYLRDDFDYTGPRFGWSFVPDQLVIDQVHRGHIAARTAASPPLLAIYQLTSSHHPWSSVPPYLEDWDKLSDGSIYRRVAGLRFADNQFVSGGQYVAGYDASVRYSLHSVFAYLERLPADQAPLVIILGDHQPRHPVAEMDADSWWVPLHVLSRDPQALARFEQLGYAAGFVPDAAAPTIPLERFIEQLRAGLAR